MERTVFRACNLCEAICGLEIRVDADGTITSIRGDRDDPFSRGHICPKALALDDVHRDPDRLRRPQLRQADGSFAEIGWAEAFDVAASKIRALQAAHGHDTIAVYLGNPNVHNYGTLLFGPPLLRLLRTRFRYSATSVDQLPHHLASRLMFGHSSFLPVPDLDHTQYFLIFGGNPAVSNGSMMTAPDVKKRLKAVRARGGRVVVVDPRRSESAEIADRHHFLRPGTDAFLLLAMIHTLIAEDLIDCGRLRDLTRGLDELPSLVAGFAPELVESVCGVEADAIRQLAREFAAAPAAVAYGRMGASTQEFGSLAIWLINVLNVITGNLDREGGAMFPNPAVDLAHFGHSAGKFGRWHSLVRGLPEFGGELPVATLAEDLEHADGPRALITIAGNPVLSTPNGPRLEAALEKLDFQLAIDIYINETTRHADLILPPTAALEHDHYDLIFNALAIRDVARFSEAVFEPGPEARHDWQILLELTRRLDPEPDPKTSSQREFAAAAGPAGLLDLALKQGPYGLSLEQLRAAPHGLDLGPLTEALPQRLPQDAIDLCPDHLITDLERLAARRSGIEAEAKGLVLIGRRHLQSNNSWLHNSERLLKGKERCTLLIRPDDAASRSLEAGARARVRSRVGVVEVQVEISDEVMPGVVSLPHGWGHQRPGVGWRVAAQTPGPSINDLTDDQRVDALTGNAAFSGLPVEVELA